MKSTIFVSLCVAGALLQGCTAGVEPGGLDIDGQDITDDAVGSDPSSAQADDEIDAKIATLDVPGGQVVFIDEGLTEPGGGIAFWEVGDVDLSYLLDGLNGTALEVFLALAPEGTPPPRRLVEHHREVASRVGGIPAEPRRFAAAFALPEHVSLTNEGLNDGNSDTDRDCWAWAGTSSPYSSNLGYQSFDYSDFQDNFNTQYSQISGTFVTSGLSTAMSNASDSSVLGPTSAGHERAMAFCLSKAVNTEGGGSLASNCQNNVGRARVFVERTTDSTYTNWSTADSILLTSFGQGGRFRSNYTNSGGAARKYRIYVEWQTLISEGGSGNLFCKDQIVLAWRSRQDVLGPGGFESL